MPAPKPFATPSLLLHPSFAVAFGLPLIVAL